MSLTKKMPKNRTSANNSHGDVDAEAADADARLELVDAAAAADARFLELVDAAAAAADARFLELVDAAAVVDAAGNLRCQTANFSFTQQPLAQLHCPKNSQSGRPFRANNSSLGNSGNIRS